MVLVLFIKTTICAVASLASLWGECEQRGGPAGVPTSEAETAVKAALDDFFGKKKSKLHR